MDLLKFQDLDTAAGAAGHTVTIDTSRQCVSSWLEPDDTQVWLEAMQVRLSGRCGRRL